MPVLNFKNATAEKLKIIIDKGFVRNATSPTTRTHVVLCVQMIYYIVFEKTSTDLNGAQVA